MFEIAVQFRVDEVLNSKKLLIESAQAALDLQVIKDSNYYCPEDTGTLQASAIMSSQVGSGLVMWATPYAREQYYGKPNKSLDRNPNARMKWFEEAKAVHLQDWLRIAMERVQ